MDHIFILRDTEVTYV